MKNVIIAGHGVAGLTAGDTLRRFGYDGALTVIGQEPHATYSRPALSKAALASGPELDVNFLPEPTHGAAKLFGRTAVALDPANRVLSLDDGSELSYDGLVIATGSRARRFSDSPNEYTLRSLDDAIALKQRLQSRPRVSIIGGGPLGMEVASGAMGLGCQVSLVEAGLPMRAQMGSFIGHMLTDAAIEYGVEIIDAMVEAVVPSIRANGVDTYLDDGRVLRSHIVVSAIGDIANDEWLAESGLLTDGRLVVNVRGEVCPGVVAAGDVAWLEGPSGPRRQAVWTSAIEQAKTAAASLVLGDKADPLNFQPYFWTHQFGLNVKICGPIPADTCEPIIVQGDVTQRKAVLHWPDSGTAAAVNFRVPIPKLRKLALSQAVAV